jgi:hypothetical protein
MVEIRVNHESGLGFQFKAPSALDGLLYETKFDCANWFIFLYVLGILVEYTRTKFQRPISFEWGKLTTAQMLLPLYLCVFLSFKRELSN